MPHEDDLRADEKNIALFSLCTTLVTLVSRPPSIKGLGNIGGEFDDGEETKGFIGHFALAVTEEGLPLGL